MDKTTLKISMAGLFHDIGKVADKRALTIDEGYINDNSQYLKSWDGRFSHHHAVYTAAFIERYKDDLPAECNARQWGEGDSFINLAAGHHNPYTPLQNIVTTADRLAAGIDRDTFAENDPGISPREYKSTRLLPLFEQLMQLPKENNTLFKWAYPLQTLTPDSIFPQLREAQPKTDDQKEYLALFDTFAEELRELQHRDSNPELWLEHFDSLMMRYFSQVPAARAGKVVPDVSLYDHCRLTAAFSAALYLYHRDTETLETRNIQDEADKKFLLISGNFYGIQDFIFTSHGSSQKYRSKILRGRSFYVSLMTDLAADMLCRKIGLGTVNIIINAAGRFTILAPNTLKVLKAAEEIESIVNQWLIAIAFGETSMGFTSLAARQADFLPENFVSLWEKMGRRIEEKKYTKFDLSKYGGAVSDYLDRFDNRLEAPLCPLCGKRPADSSTVESFTTSEVQSTCPICRDQVHIGTLLVRETRIVVMDAAAELPGKLKSLSDPIFGKYQLTFTTDETDEKISPYIFKLWDISISDETGCKCPVTRKYINGYVPRYFETDLADPRCAEGDAEDESPEVGNPKTFHHISASARQWDTSEKLVGLDAIGVLKADIDYLGMLMSCGLETSRFTVSRIATLSRQLNYFFALHLPAFLNRDSRFGNVYTVFAGGDDLFLIGPWNRMYELALELRNQFRRYVCENDEIHFSAGITLHKPHAPLNRLARQAENALERSKQAGRNRFTMFNATALWDDLDPLETIRKEFEDLLLNGWITAGMLYRLNGLIELVDREKKVLETGTASINAMACLKWRAMLSYSAQRNIAASVKDKQKKKEIIAVVTPKLAAWLDEFKGNLRIPLWNLLYNRR